VLSQQPVGQLQKQYNKQTKITNDNKQGPRETNTNKHKNA